MRHVGWLSAVGVLAVLASALGPSSAGAETHPYTLHVQGRLGSHDSAIDIAVPWESDKAGSPFNFTSDACDDIALEKLRKAWTALKQMPEGRTVTIETRTESIVASRATGYLVLQPHRRDDRDDHHTRVKIPDYIVDAIVDHDGRLTDHDLERLLSERGKVTLVKVNSDVGGATVWLDRAKAESD